MLRLLKAHLRIVRCQVLEGILKEISNGYCSSVAVQGVPSV